jgi:hypothetical protein
VANSVKSEIVVEPGITVIETDAVFASAGAPQ